MLINRIGHIGLGLGMMAIFSLCQTASFAPVLAIAPLLARAALTERVKSYNPLHSYFKIKACLREGAPVALRACELTWPLHGRVCALPLCRLGWLSFLVFRPAAPLRLSMHSILLERHLSALRLAWCPGQQIGES